MNKIVYWITVLVLIASGLFFLTKYKFDNNYSNTTPSPTPSVLSKPVVKSATNPALGTYLTDGNGLTLYMPLGPCWGSCLDDWVPYLATSTPIDRASGDPLFNNLNRYPLRDGGYQYGYGERLLYWYRGDKIVGDTNGHNIENGQWTVIKLP